MTAPSPPRQETARARGVASQGRHDGDHGSCDYLLYVPALAHGSAVPLVVMLHGCGQNPDDFSRGTRMNQLADELGFVVVYPGQCRSANVARCWNWFDPVDQLRERGEPALIAGITRRILGDHHIDPEQVFVAGLSAGGAMAAIMARTYPDVYAAAGVHSGLAYGSARDVSSALAVMKGRSTAHHEPAGPVPARQVPLIAFQGDQDDTVHPDNLGRVVSDVVRDGKITENAGEAGGRPYLRRLHHQGGRVVAEAWLIHGAGHAWSGGDPAGSHTDAGGPDASREMLRFFFNRAQAARAAA